MKSEKKLPPRQQKRNETYNAYVEMVTPKRNLFLAVLKAYILGGGICLLGQAIVNLLMQKLGLAQMDANVWCSIILVLISVVLTALNLYPSLANWGGAGALVPITGFANGVCSSAIEFKKEGQVFGIGCQIFRIAGPVILYGIFSGWLAGIAYWIWGLFR